MKLIVIISTIGRIPAIAAPVAEPIITDSALGAVADAFRAELLEEAARDRVAPLVRPDVFPHQKDAVVRLQGLLQSLSDRFPYDELSH